MAGTSLLALLMPTLLDALTGIVAGALMLAGVTLVQRLFRKAGA